jgi:hypothetical protein
MRASIRVWSVALAVVVLAALCGAAHAHGTHNHGAADHKHDSAATEAVHNAVHFDDADEEIGGATGLAGEEGEDDVDLVPLTEEEVGVYAQKVTTCVWCGPTLGAGAECGACVVLCCCCAV